MYVLFTSDMVFEMLVIIYIPQFSSHQSISAFIYIDGQLLQKALSEMYLLKRVPLDCFCQITIA